jgi:DNA-binding NarL/FixJ family response regulator
MLTEKLKNKNGSGETEVLVFNGNPILSEALDVCQDKKPNFHFFKENALTAKTLEFLESSDIDLVIIDISVEDENGPSMTEQLRTDYPMRPIIILTIEDEKNSSKMETLKVENNSTVQKVSSEILQALDYANSLLRCQVYGFIISLDI